MSHEHNNKALSCLSMVTLTWHVIKYKVHKHHQRHILKRAQDPCESQGPYTSLYDLCGYKATLNLNILNRA